MANYVELLVAHDLLQSRIDRAVAVLENPSKYNHEIRVEALKILKGEA